MNKINPEFKQRWLTALRSGKYAQGQRALRQHGTLTGATSYCCLGVALDVKDATQWKPSDSSSWQDDWNGCRSAIANNLLAKAIDEALEETTVQILARFNDRGDTFANIAEWIESHL